MHLTGGRIQPPFVFSGGRGWLEQQGNEDQGVRHGKIVARHAAAR